MSHPIGSGLTLNALNWPTTSGRKRTSVRGCAAESAALATIATAIQHTCARYVMSVLRFTFESTTPGEGLHDAGLRAAVTRLNVSSLTRSRTNAETGHAMEKLSKAG